MGQTARTCRAASTVGTMLIDEALHFMRMGTFLERADNTARLVDVKFHAAADDGAAARATRIRSPTLPLGRVPAQRVGALRCTAKSTAT